MTHCSFAWLVEHAAWLHTIKKKQSDGITAYQRLRGRSFGSKLLGFGECCLYMLQRKSQDRSLEGTLGSKWKEGIFLGYSRDSNEYLLWCSESKGVVRARSIQRKPESQRYDPELLGQVNQRPQDMFYRASAAPSGRREPQDDLDERLAPEDEPPKTRITGQHDLRVTLQDLKDFGYTELGCQRCDHIRAHGHGRDCVYAHSAACRSRIKEEDARRQAKGGSCREKKEGRHRGDSKWPGAGPREITLIQRAS